MKFRNSFQTGFYMLVFIVSAFFAGCDKKVEDETHDTWLNETFSSMTAEMKIGQLFCLSVDPVRYFIIPEYKRNINMLIRKYKPGAIYLSTIIEDWKPETLSEFNGSKLLAEIIRMHELQGIPLLIGADFENGAWFWDKQATRFSLPMALGTTRSPGMAYRQGKITAIEAKAQGINLIFAPVLNTCDFFAGQSKIRSFGNNIENIALLGENFIKGCQEVGAASCLKYFPPGEILSSWQINGERDYLYPFRKSVEAGALSIMVLEDFMLSELNNIASAEGLNTVREVIRNELDFQGLAINMLAPGNDSAFTPEQQKERIFAYLDADINMFVLPETTETEIPVIDLLTVEAEKGRLDMKTVEASVMRILTLKDKLDIHFIGSTVPVKGIAGMGLAEYKQTAEDISDASITLVKNEGNILPLDCENQFITSVCFADEHSVIEAAAFHRKLTEQYKNIKHMSVIGNPENRIVKEIMRRVSEADAVLCSFFIKPNLSEETMSEETLQLIRRILKANDNSAAVSFYSPYIINHLPQVKGFLVMYSPTERSMDAALEVVFESRKPHGKLPADLYDLFPEGHGLEY